MTKVGTFDQAAWGTHVRGLIDDARPKNAAADPAWMNKAASTVAPLMTQLREVDPGLRGAIFFEQIEKKDAFPLLAALHGKSVDDVRRNFAMELLALGSGTVRAADAPSPVDLKPLQLSGCDGKVSIGVGDISKVPAELIVIPDHRSKQSGGLGGVALALSNRLTALEESTGKPQMDARHALSEYEVKRGDDTFRPGKAVISWTNFGNPSLFPDGVIRIASVPDARLQARTDYPTVAAREAHLGARVEYTTNVVDCAFDAIDEAIDRSKMKEGRVAMPVILTGPKGALGESVESYAMAGKLIGDRMRKFYQNPANAKIEIAIILYNSDPDTFPDKQAAIESAISSGKVPQILEGSNQRFNVRSLDVVLSDLLRGLELPKAGGVAFNEAYLKAKIGDQKSGFVKSFMDKLKAFDDAALNDRSVVIAGLEDPVDGELFRQIHKFLELAELTGGKDDQPAPVTRERIQALLTDEKFQKQLSGALMHDLDPVTRGGFAGDGKMAEILPVAIGSRLQQIRWRHLEDTHKAVMQQVDPKDREIKELKAQLAGSIDAEALDQLQAKYELALDKAKSKEKESKEWRDAATNFQRQASQLTGDNQDLRRQVSTLQQKIADKEQIVQQYQAKPVATAYRSYSR